MRMRCTPPGFAFANMTGLEGALGGCAGKATVDD